MNSIALKWKRNSGRFSKTDNPRPFYEFKDSTYDLIRPDKKRRTGLQKFLGIWRKKATVFEETPLYLSLLKWNRGICPHKPMEERLLECLRNKMIPPPPYDYYDLKQARAIHNREWELPEKTLKELKTFDEEFRNRKKFLIYESLSETFPKGIQISESVTTNSVYFYIGGEENLVRLSDHVGNPELPYKNILNLNYTQDMEFIRKKILIFSKKIPKES